MGTYAEELDQVYDECVGQVVRRLRATADRLARPRREGQTHRAHARWVIHEAVNLLPSMGFDALLEMAQQADEAES